MYRGNTKIIIRYCPKTKQKEVFVLALDFNVNIPPQDAIRIIDKAIVDGSITGERIDYHTVTANDETSCIIAVYEKHFYRAGNRLTLTVIVNNMQGLTNIHCISGGGGEGLFRFDWGASDSFEDTVLSALENYKI